MRRWPGWCAATTSTSLVQSVGRQRQDTGTCNTYASANTTCSSPISSMVRPTGSNTKWVFEEVDVGTGNKRYYISSAARSGCPKRYLCMQRNCSVIVTEFCTVDQLNAHTVWLVDPVIENRPAAPIIRNIAIDDGGNMQIKVQPPSDDGGSREYLACLPA